MHPASCEGKADLATVKTKRKERFEKMAENKEVLHSSFSYFNRYRCFIFALLKQVLTISIAELKNENG